MRCNSSRAYVARLQKCEIELQKIDVEKVLDVLGACVGHERAMKIILSDENLVKKMEDSRVFKKEHLLKINPMNDLREYYLNADYSAIMTIASTKAGVTRQDIVEICGKKGERHLQDLLDQGVLELVDNCRIKISTRFLKEDEIVAFSRQDCRDFRIPTLLKHYNPQNANQNTNAIIARVESLNDDAIKKAHQLTSEFVQSIGNLLTDPESRGEIPYFITLAMDKFTQNKNATQHREVLQ